MKIFGMWYGGSSYGMPDPFNREDVEEFFSIEAAIHEMDRRCRDRRYPCIEMLPPDEGGHYMYLFKSDPFEQGDLMPDYILEYTMLGTLKKRRL